MNFPFFVMKINIIFLVLFAYVFVSCAEKGHNEALVARRIIISSGDAFENIYIKNNLYYIYKDEKLESAHCNIGILFSPAINQGDRLSYSPAYSLEELIDTDWKQKHYKDFENMNLEEVFQKDYFQGFPLFGGIYYSYLQIKAVKLYSPSQEVAGRPAGTDLSDLFNYQFHPRLYSYPDCSFVFPAYCEPDGEVLTLADMVKFKLIPEEGMNFMPMFNISNSQFMEIPFRIEMTIEDDVCGERTFVADTSEPKPQD